MNIGDLVVQLIIIVILLGLIFSAFVVIRLLVTKSSKDSNVIRIEQKLDRIIELRQLPPPTR